MLASVMRGTYISLRETADVVFLYFGGMNDEVWRLVRLYI